MKTSHAAILGFFAIAISANAIVQESRAQESRTGTIARLDEANGTIAIAETPTATVGSSAAAPYQEFKVQDGLTFNAFKEGDQVSFKIEEVSGVKTVTKLEKK
jgi:Cu/Ag efflux protein CusF